MAAAAPAGSGGRASTPFQHDWEALVRGDALKREDIYRQRVFGNNSGAKDFIQFEDRREFKWPMLVLYIIFAILASMYADPRMKINVYFKVNDAVQTAILSTPFVADPVARYFKDINTMQDVQDFLLNAFPIIVAPKVQNFNYPMGAVRFTLRKMQSEQTPGDRFVAFTSTIWENTDGISPDEQSTENDDKENFGIYRVWANASLDWSVHPMFENRRCPKDAELIDTVSFRGIPKEQRDANCKRWCAQLRFPKTCHCFSTSKMSDGTCNFYQVPLQSFIAQGDGTGGLVAAVDSIPNSMIPKVRETSMSDVFYPLMKQFDFTSDSRGFQGTPGFIQNLKLYSQEQLDQASPDPTIGLTTPQRLIHSTIDDWIQGGFLGAGAATLAVDFATHNPNYDVFTWVNLIFTLSSSGYVKPELKLESMQVRNEQDINVQWTPAEEMWGNFWDLAYFILVIFYICWELWEMSCCNRGLKYFTSMWNWVTLLSVLLHAATIAMWWQLKSNQEFVTRLQDLRKQGDDAVFAPDGEEHLALNGLGIQIASHKNFKVVCAFNLFFVLMQLLRYLSDIQPRVKVLIDTVSNSVVPIGFMALVVMTALLGICICTNVVFGREVVDFNSLPSSVRTIFLLTIGEFDAIKRLREVFGDSAFFFYLPYMTFNIIIIVNFPRAVLNAAYEDAQASHTANVKNETSRQRAMETNINGDWGRMKKTVINFIKSMFPEDFKVEDMHKQVARHSQGSKYKSTAMAGYLFFNFVFVVMTYMITRTEKSNRMMQLVERAVKTPSFITTNDMSGEMIEGGNFDSITTRKDIESWFSQVLPDMMYASSKGTLDGDMSFLKEYASAYPTIFQQLVINNWNIMVGQKPVRITSRMAKMTPLGSGRAITGVTTPLFLIRESGQGDTPAEVSKLDGLPASTFKGATDFSEVVNDKQRTSLQNYCEYSFGYGVSQISEDGKNPDKEGYGFVCMLDINEAATRDELTYMSTHEMITDQTMSLAFEFVIYNAYAKTFAYVSVWFAFDPSGMIYKDIRVESITLELYDDFWGIVQLVVELLVLFLNLVYFLQLMVTLFKTVRDSSVEKKSGTGPQGARRVFGWIQTIVCFFVFDLLNPLELLSCVVTILTMTSWYQFVFGPLAQNYFFMEQPVWVEGFCTSNNFEWCSDSEVLTKFFSAQGSFRLFIQMCAMNTILVFLRILKFLRPYPHMRVIFKTFGRAFGDLVWFVIVYCIILSGYTMLGHYIFGTGMEDYSTMIDSLRSCFEMFLGTVDFRAMSQAHFGMMFFFTSTFWFVLKLLAFNMFLAIIDKNYQSEKREHAQFLKEQAEQQDKEPKKPSFFAAMRGQMMAIVKGSRKGNGDSSAQAADSPASGTEPVVARDTAQKGENKEAEENSEDEEPVQENILDLVGTVVPGLGDDDKEDDEEDDHIGDDEVADAEELDSAALISAEKVQDPRWNSLPKGIRDWAIDKAQGLCRFLADDEALSQIFKKETAQVQEKGPTEREVELENAESNMKKKKKELSTAQKRTRRELDEAELSELKKVHQDQESLSWYIMKREAELKKLESQKDLKRDRYEKLVNATKSLISSKDQGFPSPPETCPDATEPERTQDS